MQIKRKKLKVEVPSVAMGDIAFNLLIFFVILANPDDESHLKWKTATTTKVEVTESVKASVLVDENNDLYLNGRQIGINQLTPGLEKILGDTPPGQRTVLLKIHETTQAQRFEPIIEAVSAAGGDMVHVLTEKKP
jgi:biopolymer transport protein ExbD